MGGIQHISHPTCCVGCPACHVCCTACHFRVFLISVCRAKFGESRNLEKMIGTPPLDDQMNISLQKNVLNSLQPPKTASTGPKFCCSQKDSFLKGSFRCSPNHIQHWNMECHTPLERSRIAFYGYVNFWSPNQTIWWLEALKATQRWPWFAYMEQQNENFWHWVKSSTSLAFRKTWCHT